VFRRFSRWSIKGVWWRIFETMSDDPDFEYLIVDPTIVRAHQHAAGAKTYGPPRCKRDEGWFEQSAQTYPACRQLWPLPRWRSARPDPNKGAGLEGQFSPEVFGTPIDCQAIFTTRSSLRRTKYPPALVP